MPKQRSLVIVEFFAYAIVFLLTIRRIIGNGLISLETQTFQKTIYEMVLWVLVLVIFLWIAHIKSILPMIGPALPDMDAGFPIPVQVHRANTALGRVEVAPRHLRKLRRQLGSSYLSRCHLTGETGASAFPHPHNYASRKQLVESLPRDGVSSYFVWTPKITEELLLGSHAVFVNVLTLIAALAARGVPVGHQHGNYSIAAMHDFGLDAVTHHLGWVDHGEPAEQPGFARRSCRTYVPGVRHCLYFDRAGAAGRHLDRDQYAARYCECPFCLGVFDEMGKPPLDLLLEDKVDVDRRGRSYHTPTSRAVASTPPTQER